MKNKKYMNFRKQKASVLVFALIVLFIGISASIGIVSSTIISQKNSINTASSVQSFQVADSGAEILLRKFKEADRSETLDDLGLPCSGGVITGNIGTGKEYSITTFRLDETDPITDCDTTTLAAVNRIKSVGSYKNTSRAVLVTSQKRCFEKDDAVLGFWRMDETGGTVVADSAESNDGDATGTTIVDGVSGKARSFNGSSDYVSVDATLTTAVKNWSLEAWIKPANLNQLSLAVYNGDDSGGYGFGVGNGSGGAGSKLQGLFGWVVWIDSGYTFPSANEWYYVAITRNETTTKAYVNGVQTSNTTTSTPNPPTADKFSIGAQLGGSTSCTGSSCRNFNGIIDEVRVSNVVRDESYFSDYYDCMKPN